LGENVAWGLSTALRRLREQITNDEGDVQEKGRALHGMTSKREKRVPAGTKKKVMAGYYKRA